MPYVGVQERDRERAEHREEREQRHRIIERHTLLLSSPSKEPAPTPKRPWWKLW